jgi:hypothetical protein
MTSIAIIAPSSEWGVLVLATALQSMRRKHGPKADFSVCGMSWCDESMQNMLPGRPHVMTMQEMVARRFDHVVSLTDSVVNAWTAAALDASGIVNVGGRLCGTSPEYDFLVSCYLGNGKDVFSALGECLGVESRALPVFFPPFDPKMHERQGVSIKDEAVRSAVKNRFFETGRLWHVPLRRSLSKRIEESRTVSALVTDDPVCAWGCASGGGRSILLRRKACACPMFHVQDMVEEEFIDSYDQS